MVRQYQITAAVAITLALTASLPPIASAHVRRARLPPASFRRDSCPRSRLNVIRSARERRAGTSVSGCIRGIAF
jgi:hypothetical protein